MAEHYGGWRAKRLRSQVKDAYGSVCWLCGLEINDAQFSVDHVIPRSRGGTDDLFNCRPAHRSCNSKRGNRAPKRRRQLRTATSW